MEVVVEHRGLSACVFDSNQRSFLTIITTKLSTTCMPDLECQTSICASGFIAVLLLNMYI